jgi:hypothetical protein
MKNQIGEEKPGNTHQLARWDPWSAVTPRAYGQCNIACGSDPFYFSRLFKQKTGVIPTKWRTDKLAVQPYLTMAQNPGGIENAQD